MESSNTYSYYGTITNYVYLVNDATIYKNFIVFDHFMYLEVLVGSGFMYMIQQLVLSRMVKPTKTS